MIDMFDISKRIICVLTSMPTDFRRVMEMIVYEVDVARKKKIGIAHTTHRKNFMEISTNRVRYVVCTAESG